MTEPVSAAAMRFLHAILWGEHLVVWEMLSSAGREHVLSSGERRGLDPLQAQRLRLGTSPVEERDEFLSGLVHGLRMDFSRVPLEDVRPAGEVARGEGAVEVALECRSSFGPHGWAAGALVLSQSEAEWRVDRIEPVATSGG